MKSIGIFLIALTFLIYSCTNNKQQSIAGAHPASNDTVQFFPVIQFIKKEIARVDTFPYFIYELNVQAQKKDSSVITRSRFNELAMSFIKTDISDLTIKRYYKESVFDDEGTNSITISYATENTALPVRSIQVLLTKEEQQVKWIFINKTDTFQNRQVIQKLGWKAGQSFYINTIIADSINSSGEQHISVVWNNKE